MSKFLSVEWGETKILDLPNGPLDIHKFTASFEDFRVNGYASGSKDIDFSDYDLDKVLNPTQDEYYDGCYRVNKTDIKVIDIDFVNKDGKQVLNIFTPALGWNFIKDSDGMHEIKKSRDEYAVEMSSYVGKSYSNYVRDAYAYYDLEYNFKNIQIGRDADENVDLEKYKKKSRELLEIYKEVFEGDKKTDRIIEIQEEFRGEQEQEM